LALKIIWSPRATDHLEAVYKFIARDSEEYACHFIDRILEIVEAIPDFPQSGRIVPEYRDPNLREKMRGLSLYLS